MSSLYFLIEGGKALDLVKSYIEAKLVCHNAVRAVLHELGCTEYYHREMDGTLLGVRFPPGVDVPVDFKKPNRTGHQFPRKGSDWEKRFDALPKYFHESSLIQEELHVPTVISYEKEGKEAGVSRFGNPLNECGFLFLGKDGPYAMWIPDVQAEVTRKEKEGYTVAGPAKSFIAEFEGCRRIEKEEWELLVAQHRLDKKRKQNEGVSA